MQITATELKLNLGKSHFYKNVFRAAEGQKFTRENVSETQRRVYNAFSNVLISHFADDQPSLLRNEFHFYVF